MTAFTLTDMTPSICGIMYSATATMRNPMQIAPIPRTSRTRAMAIAAIIAISCFVERALKSSRNPWTNDFLPSAFSVIGPPMMGVNKGFAGFAAGIPNLTGRWNPLK